jgi:HEAT repeat protein
MNQHVKELISMVRSEDAEISQSAADEIVRLNLKEAIPEVTKLLCDDEGQVRESAIRILVKLESSKPARLRHSGGSIQAIAKLVNDSDDDVRVAAILALGRLGAQETIMKIMKLLKNRNVKIRSSAVFVLGELNCTKSIPDIIKLLSDEDEWVRGAAVLALGKLGAKTCIPHIVKLMKDENNWVRANTLYALSNLCASDLIPDILKLTADNNRYVRGAAAIALVEMGLKERVTKELQTDIKAVADITWRRHESKRAQSALCILGQKYGMP